MMNKENLAAAVLASAIFAIALIGVVRALHARAELDRASSQFELATPQAVRMMPHAFELR
jgi:hypothetical protein